jgi:Na+(H+)/acetate symporter ActP
MTWAFITHGLQWTDIARALCLAGAIVAVALAVVWRVNHSETSNHTTDDSQNSGAIEGGVNHFHNADLTFGRERDHG